MQISYCLVSIAPIRIEPKDSSEMTTQLLFGEVVEIIENERQWRKIRNLLDGYEGWVDEKLLAPLTEKEMKKWMDEQVPSFNSLLAITGDFGKIELTKGAMLPFEIQNDTFRIGKDEYQVTNPLVSIPENWSVIAESYLNSPYLWGGRTNFGIDCSGFTQIVYRFQSFSLPRDAYQQAEDGMNVEFEEVIPGDLAFFNNEAGKITHVGIVLKDNKIIHASGRIRIDELKKEGIFNLETKLLTHKLCLIKRYF